MNFTVAIADFVMEYSYFAILLCLVLGSVGFPFPEDAILISTGYFIAQKSLSPMPALLAATVGLLLSDLILFWLGRRYGRRISTHRWFGKLITVNRLVVLENLFNSYGLWVILIGRQIFGVRSQIIMISGMTRIPLPRYLISDTAAVLISMSIMITTGYLGGEALEQIRAVRNNLTSELLVAAAVVAVLFVRVRFRNKPRPGIGG